MEVFSISMREGLQRKKYMGEWRQESRQVRVKMARFPGTVSTHINREKQTGGSGTQGDEKIPEGQIL